MARASWRARSGLSMSAMRGEYPSWRPAGSGRISQSDVAAELIGLERRGRIEAPDADAAVGGHVDDLASDHGDRRGGPQPGKLELDDLPWLLVAERVLQQQTVSRNVRNFP